jgi:hypothetical protein
MIKKLKPSYTQEQIAHARTIASATLTMDQIEADWGTNWLFSFPEDERRLIVRYRLQYIAAELALPPVPPNFCSPCSRAPRMRKQRLVI